MVIHLRRWICGLLFLFLSFRGGHLFPHRLIGLCSRLSCHQKQSIILPNNGVISRDKKNKILQMAARSQYRNTSENNSLQVIDNIKDFFLHLYRDLLNKPTRVARLEVFKERIKLLYSSLIINSKFVQNSPVHVSNQNDKLLIPSVLMAMIIVGLPPLMATIIYFFGFLCITLGTALIVNGIWSLKENISFFITPCNDNYIVTNNSYDLVTHPIYGGIILFCFGLSLVSKNANKLFITIALYFYFVSYNLSLYNALTRCNFYTIG